MSKEDDYFKEQDKKKKEYAKEDLKNSSFELDKSLEWKVAICIAAAYILFGVFSLFLGDVSAERAMYFFGLVFFLAGAFVCMYIPVFGIIFLFSHGLTGLSLMIMGLLGENELSLNIITNGDKINFNLLSPMGLILSGFLAFIIVNLVKPLKKSIYKFLPFIVILGGLVVFCMQHY